MPAFPMSLVITSERTSIPILEGKIDGYPIETHRLVLTTTRYPVEIGSALTDNAVKEPDKLRIEGWVSSGLRALDNQQRGNEDVDAWETIYRTMETRQLVEIFTPIRVYRNMLISRAETTRTVNTGPNGLKIILELVEVISAQTDFSIITPNLRPTVTSGEDHEFNRGITLLTDEEDVVEVVPRQLNVIPTLKDQGIEVSTIDGEVPGEQIMSLDRRQSRVITYLRETTKERVPLSIGGERPSLPLVPTPDESIVEKLRQQGNLILDPVTVTASPLADPRNLFTGSEGTSVRLTSVPSTIDKIGAASGDE